MITKVIIHQLDKYGENLLVKQRRVNYMSSSAQHR
jgi:hypothetical protein